MIKAPVATLPALKVGQKFTDQKTGEGVIISHVDREFVSWRDQCGLGYGKMLRVHFGKFYQRKEMGA